MEITIKILELDALVNALNNLASAFGGRNIQHSNNQPVQPTQQTPVQNIPAYQQPVQQAPVQQAPVQTPTYQQPIQQAAPVNTPNQNFIQQQVPNTQAPIQQVPTSHGTQNYTQDQLAVAMTALHDAGKLDAVMGALSQFGAETLMQVPKEQYAALATMLRGAGANI